MRHGIVDERRTFFEKMNEFHSRKNRVGSQKILTEVSYESIPRSIPVFSKIKRVSYQVYVSTAGYKSAGTDKPVYIQISGDFGNSEFILLDDASPNISESGMHYANPDSIDPGQDTYGFPTFSVRDFRFKAAFVGNVANISLRHDPKGFEHSAWRPENILVVSIHLQRAWLFTSSTWLSYEGGNQVTLKPTKVVYAGRRSCRNVSQALLMLKSHYAKINILSDVKTSDRELEKSCDLKLIHAIEVQKSEMGTQKVRFQLQKFTKTSTHIYLLGNTVALGEWDPERAVRMHMIIAQDGTWRGDWNIELDLDSDFDEIKYTYLTMVEGRIEDHRRYIHYGDVHKLNLSTLISSENHSEERVITTDDNYEECAGPAPGEELTSSASCDEALSGKEKVREAHSDSGKELNYLSTKLNSSFRDSISTECLSTKDVDLQRGEEKGKDKTKEWKSVENEIPMKDNMDERRSENSLKNPDEPPQIYHSSTETDTSVIKETQSNDHEYILGGINEPSLTKLRTSLHSSDQQLLQSSNDIKNRKSELLMLKNNIRDLNDSFFQNNAHKSNHTNASFLLKEVSLNLKRYRNLSTNLSGNLRKKLTNIKEDILSLDEILRERTSQLRESIKEKDRFQFRKLEKYVSEREHLENRLAKEFEEKRDLFNKVQDLQGNIRVFCRVRPMLNESKGDSQIIPGLELVEVSHGHQNHIELDGKQFRFQYVFPPSSSQHEVYEKTGGVLRSVLDGYNVCIMAYGQTGSGKTFTMNGTKHNKGVNYRALEDLFKVAEERASQFNIIFCISVLEIYNETLRDLLERKVPEKKLDIRIDASSSSGKAVFVQNLTKFEVNSAENSWQVLEQAMENRSTEKTEMNEHSSRSHLISKIYVSCEQRRTGMRTSGELTFVDLAGSERVSRSKVSGDRLKEAQSINKSLSTLGDVFNAIISRSSHIPFRNSKLTHFLQDSIGGSSKTLMFFNISPSMKDFTETISSLQFSQRVAKVELGFANRKISKKENSDIRKSLQSKEMELRSLSSKLAGMENENKKKTLLLGECERKLRILEEELRRTKNRLECSKQNEREQGILFEKRLKEMNKRQTVSYGSSLFKDAKWKHQKEQKLVERDRNLAKKNEHTKRPIPSPISSHMRPPEAPFKKIVFPKTNHAKRKSSDVSLDKTLTERGQKISLSNSLAALGRSVSAKNASRLSFSGLPRSLSSNTTKLSSQLSRKIDGSDGFQSTSSGEPKKK